MVCDDRTVVRWVLSCRRDGHIDTPSILLKTVVVDKPLKQLVEKNYKPVNHNRTVVILPDFTSKDLR